MTIYIGLDIGAVSVKTAALMPRDLAESIVSAKGAASQLRLLSSGRSRPSTSHAGTDDLAALILPPVRTRGRPLDAANAALSDLLQTIGSQPIAGVIVTGSGGSLVADALELPRCNEFQALARAMDLLHPHVRSVFEIGGETSKYLKLAADPASGTLGIVDYSTNGDCAAGTGSFLDQQALRLKYTVQEIGDIVATADRSAQIAGRCSVFAKSDMIHAQQKGFTPPEVLRGLCRAVALNYKSAVVKGRTPLTPIAFVGGVSANSAVVTQLREAFELGENDMFVPEAGESLCAVGAAIIGFNGGGTYGGTCDAGVDLRARLN
ncbi:MAG: 2-hydroxyglutaryl-CoA dehydratase [Phycisphaerae bacterium]|nr:2-hydroxyglutaryl-CoA dehydratase [Phycisphaerae bacterium]